MKTLKSFILVSLFISASEASFACGPWYYGAETTDIYRILPYGAEGPALQLNPDFRKRNILLWSRQTGFRDTTAIRQALYTDWAYFPDWEEPLLLAQRGEIPSYPKGEERSALIIDNAFVKHLITTRNTDALQLLYWSKLYSNIREGQRSPWYYNSSLETDEAKQMREMYQELQQYNPSKKYADRYRFLAIKCSWALGDDSATIALWDNIKPKMKGGIFYSEAEDYVARSLYRIGREEEADRIYLRRGDIGSLMMLRQMTLPEFLNTLLRIDPNSPVLAIELQRMLFTLENGYFSLKYTTCIEGYMDDTAILRIAQRAAHKTVRSQRAMWNYTAACLLDYQHRPIEALHQLDGIDTLPCDTYLKNSIRVLRFYLRSKTDNITDDFEKYAISELRWMDSELQREWRKMPKRERFKLSHIGGTGQDDMHRSCYMYDAMRRILLPDTVGLCKRMAASNREIRALQFANMAENRFFQITGNEIIQKTRNGGSIEAYNWNYDWDEHKGFSNHWYNWLEPDTANEPIRYYYHLTWNSHDYSNWMFLLADKMSARTLEQYRQRQLHPQDDDDRWLNARGYTNGDYWQDIIGTHYLRECNYPAAVAHLKYVSPEYQRKMNIRCVNDPFVYTDLTPSYDSTKYKLHFAQRMVELQQQMSHGSRDSRGLAMLEYSIGMRNSFDLCWYLTSYGKSGYSDYYEIDGEVDIYDEDSYCPERRLTAIHYPYKMKYSSRAKHLQQKALTIVSSDEAKAKAYARLGMLTKVRKEYANTSTAQHLALVCDERKLYRVSKNNKHNRYIFLNKGINHYCDFVNI